MSGTISGYAVPCRQFYGDVTDNKTNDFYTKRFVYAMNDIFHREDERLKTFDSWPLQWLDKFQLAQSGMFFTGEEDKVKCYFCEVEIGRWEHEDQPVPEHLRWSPNCPLLRRRTTNNTPISVEALDRILPAVSYDICGSNDAIEVRPSSYAEGTIAPAHMTSAATTSLNVAASSGANATTYYPEYPEYVIEAARVRSFGEWPRNMKQKPEQLAEAGFFYTGVGDRVKCFSCGGGLKDWDDSDEPWEQHALWLGQCRYLKLMKGITYIDTVIAKHKAKEPTVEEAEKQAELAALRPLPAVAPLAVQTCSLNVSLDAIAAAPQVTAPAAAEAATTGPTTAAARICNAVAVSEEQTMATTAAAEKRSQTSIPEEKLCKICYAGEYNTAFLPCGHVVACAKCASSVTKCPLCRKPFTDVMRVYFS